MSFIAFAPNFPFFPEWTNSFYVERKRGLSLKNSVITYMVTLQINRIRFRITNFTMTNQLTNFFMRPIFSVNESCSQSGEFWDDEKQFWTISLFKIPVWETNPGEGTQCNYFGYPGFFSKYCPIILKFIIFNSSDWNLVSSHFTFFPKLEMFSVQICTEICLDIHGNKSWKMWSDRHTLFSK